jgi:hypothetical protein
MEIIRNPLGFWRDENYQKTKVQATKVDRKTEL